MPNPHAMKVKLHVFQTTATNGGSWSGWVSPDYIAINTLTTLLSVSVCTVM